MADFAGFPTMEEIERNARERVERGEDQGHIQLLADLKAIILNAEEFEYHDFLNKKFATPKQMLSEHLNDIIIEMRNGKYDN